ncbi:MAG: potassium-transporting ATPase subunit KdpA, partial [Oscillospiraceae bacterium]
MTQTIFQYVLYLLILVVFAVPLGLYIAKVMNGEKTIFTKVLVPCENAIYKVLKVKAGEEMTCKKYLVSVLA